MMIIGLTGGIGSGKSTVAKMFKKLGIPVYMSDREAKKLMATSKKIRKELIKLFGEDAFVAGELNRRYISEIVFKDKEMLKKLNNIVHPAVRKHFMTWAKRQKAPYVIQEAAIIFEKGTQDFYDKIILVTSSRESRIQRVMDRDNITREKVVERMENQWTDSEKKPLADFILENCDIKETLKKTKDLHNALLDYC